MLASRLPLLTLHTRVAFSLPAANLLPSGDQATENKLLSPACDTIHRTWLCPGVNIPSRPSPKPTANCLPLGDQVTASCETTASSSATTPVSSMTSFSSASGTDQLLSTLPVNDHVYTAVELNAIESRC